MSQTINERLKLLRKREGLNQADFAARLGVRNTAISRYESGERALSEQMILAVCREYGISDEWLRTGTGKMEAEKTTDAKAAAIMDVAREFRLDESDQMWLKVLLEIDPEGKKELKAAALRIAEIAASLSPLSDEAQEIVADAESAHNEQMAEWNKGLTLEEELELVRRRHEAAKNQAVASMTYAKAGSDATQKSG